jgi:hypothetical protein
MKIQPATVRASITAEADSSSLLGFVICESVLDLLQLLNLPVYDSPTRLAGDLDVNVIQWPSVAVFPSATITHKRETLRIQTTQMNGTRWVFPIDDVGNHYTSSTAVVVVTF